MEATFEQSTTENYASGPENLQVGIGIILQVAEPFRILALTDQVQ
jgi:hypothetical protein